MLSVCLLCFCLFVFFFKQKTAYEMRISDWSSDVCSSVLAEQCLRAQLDGRAAIRRIVDRMAAAGGRRKPGRRQPVDGAHAVPAQDSAQRVGRSEEHTSELQSLMRKSYAVFCLKKKRS